MPGGQIAAELTNQTAATSFTVRLQFHGFKIYNVPDRLAAM
jgi:sulfite reductase beta subunit-like hemoprotein